MSGEPPYAADRRPRIPARKQSEGRSILGEGHSAGAVLADRQEDNEPGADLAKT